MTSQEPKSDTPSRGGRGWTQRSLEPLLLLDDTISYLYAPALSAALGINIGAVKDEFQGREGVADTEIIPHLSNMSGYKAVWVTGDKDAQRAHGKLILASQISVLWLYEPKKRSLRGAEELLLLTLVLPEVHRIVLATDKPVYLKTMLNGQKARLARLKNSLLERRLAWERFEHRFP